MYGKNHYNIVVISLQLIRINEKEKEKASLKLNIQKTKIMASRSITSWQIDGKTMEAVRCESWTIKKVEHQRIDVSELWCWRRVLRVP